MNAGTLLYVRLGSSEYPVRRVAIYAGPGPLFRFHYVDLFGEKLCVHDSQLEGVL